MSSTTTIIRNVGACTLAIALFATAASAADIEVIYSEKPGHPTAQVPGATDIDGLLVVTEFKSIEAMNISADGSQWILKGRNYYDPDVENILLLGSGSTGCVFAQEGRPVHAGAPGEVYEFFDSVAGLNDLGHFAYGARARNGDPTVKEKVIKFDGAYSIVAQESDPVLGLVDLPPDPSGDEIFGNSMNSIHLQNNGRVGFVAVTITNVHSSRRPALCYGNEAFAQSGVTTIDGGIWDSFDSDDFRTTLDGAHWLAQGDDEGPTTTDDILAYDGSVVIREGSLLGGTRGAVTVTAIFHSKLVANGDWYARGDDPANLDWAVRNGSLIAQSGDPIFVGASEHWGDIFLGVTGNRNGDWVLCGNTDNGDISTDTVIVLNGTTVVVREGDPVDLDGNGIFDDDAFIGRGNGTSSAFQPDDIFLTDCLDLYLLTELRDGAGNDLGSFGTGGDAFVRVTLNTCPADIVADNNVNTDDFLAVLANWGSCPEPCPPNCPADTNCDCQVNTDDFLAVLATWGTCP